MNRDNNSISQSHPANKAMLKRKINLILFLTIAGSALGLSFLLDNLYMDRLLAGFAVVGLAYGHKALTNPKSSQNSSNLYVVHQKTKEA